VCSAAHTLRPSRLVSGMVCSMRLVWVVIRSALGSERSSASASSDTHLPYCDRSLDTSTLATAVYTPPVSCDAP